MLVLLLGIGSFAVYQVFALEDQLDSVTRAIDQMDTPVKQAQYERGKFYALAHDILNLAPQDSNAQQLVTEFGLQKLEPAQPDLMTSTISPDQAHTSTTAAPLLSATPTNAAPTTIPSPAVK
jgi:TolA-binding protein